MPNPPDAIDWYGLSQIIPAGTVNKATLTIGTSLLTYSPVLGQQAVAFLADPTNTGTIYVGDGSTVTSSDWPLKAGDYLSLDTDANIQLLASAAGQVLHVIALSS